jgi:hypothetical protein
MKHLVGLLLVLSSFAALAQVDTSFVYNPSTPYGTLDIRIAKSATRYYYLQENITQSFRESSPGVKTNTYRDMTSWDSSPYSQGNMRERNGTANYFVMNYRLLFPVNYNPDYTQGYPLIVMMHGAGERANCWETTCHWADRSYKPTVNNPPAPTTVDHNLLNNDHNLVHGGSPHLAARNLAAGKLPGDPTLQARAFPGFVLFAQNLNGWDPASVQDLIKLVRLASKKYRIDPDRIYIHGLSNGGAAVYEALKRAPWLFTAALPMSAISDGAIISKGLAPTVAHIPVWAFQGGRDTNPTPYKTESFLKKFREAGMSVRYSLYPNLGHGTWNTAYAESDFFTWMLSKTKSKLHVFFDNPSICATTGQGVKMGYAAGFKAYQWEKDGSIIADATGNEYVANTPGVYRARFSRVASPSESDWNEWSQYVTVSISDPPQALINVIGTQYMRGPDNNSAYNVVYLKSQATNDKYFWYKNGVLVNIPLTTVDDTTRTYRISASGYTANGTFTLQTKGFDNCPSPISDPVNLYFGNSGPFMTDDNIPSGFTGNATSNSSVHVQWNDNSSIEKGYEIWRRKPGDIFRLAGKTGANATSFNDIGIEPSVAYQYKIRAFNADSRSKYAPGDALTTNLVITTLPDNAAPSDPSNLVVTSNTTSSISLAWTKSTDDTGIRQYRITYGGTTVNTNSSSNKFTITGLPMNTAYNITIVAEDLGGNLSGVSNSVEGSTYVTGLTYGHSTGAWTDLDQITNWNSPEFTGVVPNFTLAPRTQEDFFNFEFKGYLYINTGGNYQFRTISDDGSRLALNDVVIVENDGVHGNVTVTSAVQAVSSGAQAINLKYFEYTGGQSLTVQYKGPDTGDSWQTIPNSALKSGSAPPVVAASSTEAVVVEDPSNSSTLRVSLYRNPSSADDINVNIESILDSPVQVRMLDMMGRPHYNKVYERNELQGTTRITPNSPLTNGIYILVVTQGKTVLKEKILIRN